MVFAMYERHLLHGLCKVLFRPNRLHAVLYSEAQPHIGNGVIRSQTAVNGELLRCLRNGGTSLTFYRQMAGHSKWQNIKHIKGLKDSARSALFTRISNMIRIAVREGGNPDPKLNSQLAQVIELARQKNMPNSTIDSAINRTQASKENMSSVLFEVRAVEGTLILVDTLTDKSARTKQVLRGSLRKLGAMVVDSGVKHAFEYKGVIDIDRELCRISVENAIDIAIEAGAEDVTETVDDDGKAVLRFLCETTAYHPVKVKLGEMGYACLPVSGLRYLPKAKVHLSDDALQIVDKVFDVLDENPDVVKVYDNIE